MDTFYRNLLLAVVVLMALVGGGYWYATNYLLVDPISLESTDGVREFKTTSTTSENLPKDQAQSASQDAETNMENESVALGSNEFGGGIFDRFEEGSIVYREGGELKSQPLTDEVVISCTTQVLQGATEVDLNMITEVKVFPRSEVSDKINQGEPIIIFASQKEEEYVVHTITVSIAVCAKI